MQDTLLVHLSSFHSLKTQTSAEMLTEMIKDNYRDLKINRFYMSILLIGLGLVFKFFEKIYFLLEFLFK